MCYNLYVKKFFILIILFFVLPVYAENTIHGGLSYTVNQARVWAFDNISYKLPMSVFQDKLSFVKSRKNKYVTFFSDGDYSVTYRKNPDYTYYYSPEDNLRVVEIMLDKVYPKKSIRYDSSGDLDSVSIDLINNEQFIFDLNKKLVVHWVGENGYNDDGELIKTRKTVY